MKTILNKFQEIRKNRDNILRQMKSETHKRILGYLCTYFPEEIAHAAGIVPVRILGDNRPLVHCDAYLPSFCCSFIKSVLELGLSNHLEYLDGFCFSHTCDAMESLSSIWQNIFKEKLFARIFFPLKLNDTYSYDFLLKEMKGFQTNLEKYTGTQITEEKLWKSIRIYDENRSLLSKIYQWNRENPGILKRTDIFNIFISGASIPKEEHNELLTELIGKLRNSRSLSSESRSEMVRVVVTGTICTIPEIFEIIEDSGALIVDDLLCTGRQSFLDFPEHLPNSASVNDDPIAYLSRRYLAKSPCAVKFHTQLNRTEILLDIVEKSKAKGVIFLFQKFCDPNSYDYFPSKNALEEKGILSVLIEYEQQAYFPERIRTQIEALVEGIKSL